MTKKAPGRRPVFGAQVIWTALVRAEALIRSIGNSASFLVWQRSGRLRYGADILSIPNTLLVVPLAPVYRGADVESDPVRTLVEPASTADVGRAVVATLDESRKLRPRLRSDGSLVAFRASGLRTKNEFNKDARLVLASRADGRIILRPTENEHARKPRRSAFLGWSGSPEWTLTEPVEPEQLGTAVRAALAACRFSPPVVKKANPSSDIRER